MTHIVRIVDFETTDIAPPQGQVVEVGTCDVDVVNRIVHPPKSWLCGVNEISPETRAVHHIRVQDVAGLEPFSGERLMAEAKADGVTAIAAHNIAFEWQWVAPHVCLPMLCTMKAAMRIWPDAPKHQNTVLRYWLEDQGMLPHGYDDELAMPPHRAGPDAYVTAHVMLALFDAGATSKQIQGWTREPHLMPRCPLGKFRNQPWHVPDRGFLEWVMRQVDMDEDTKWNVQQELNRRDYGGRP
jgi:exodeoxyribonuclease X